MTVRLRKLDSSVKDFLSAILCKLRVVFELNEEDLALLQWLIPLGE